MALINIKDETRDRLNELILKHRKINPLIRNSITQDYVIVLALNKLEGNK